MRPSSCSIYPLYCISLLINLSPPPDCELSQGKTSPLFTFVSWHCSALAGIQEAAVSVGTESIPPSGTFPFSYLQALAGENNGTMSPWPSVWNLLCKFYSFLSFNNLLAHALNVNHSGCSRSPLCSGTQSSLPLPGQRTPPNPLRKLRLFGIRNQICPLPPSFLSLILLTCWSSQLDPFTNYNYCVKLRAEQSDFHLASIRS